VACASSLETAQVGQWVCEHRDPYILRMAAFRRAVAGTAIVDWWDNGANAIAFSRGDQGFVAINNETAAVGATVETSLAPGTYCDRLTGGLAGGSCAGTTVAVNADGMVQLDLPARTAIAIDAGVRQ
jgi:alpha-amylase